MEFFVAFLHLVYVCLLVDLSPHCVRSHASPLGVHPLDEAYYASEVIQCKDGSKSIDRDRINDDFCDCADGTDEPGTSACPNGKFYCKNMGSTPQFLFSSRVNDHICDCCDGSDENDGSLRCPNTCVMGGNILYKAENHVSRVSIKNSVVEKGVKNKSKLEDLIERLTGLKILIILQLVVITLWMGFRIYHRRLKSRRRHYQRVNPH
uniref:Glucosidase II beta subunit N-terminal domain-containing protein n=1 Tax=Kalanchoe fedtschenkoi TaxID=63787 RepID=A0A7N0TJK9_KALFE